MKLDLLKQRDAYIRNHGKYPDFKTALHYGEVAIEEIADLKKEIFFTGDDVLNTTSRTQELCNQLGGELLVSKLLVDLLDLKETYAVHFLGKFRLKGKIDG